MRHFSGAQRNRQALAFRAIHPAGVVSGRGCVFLWCASLGGVNGHDAGHRRPVCVTSRSLRAALVECPFCIADSDLDRNQLPRDPRWSIPLALGLGVAFVALFYLLANTAFLHILTVLEIAATNRVGAAVAL